MIEILSWPKLAERFNLPPWGLLEEPRRWIFCPFDETETPIPPPGLDDDVEGLRLLKEKITKIKDSRRWAISEIEWKKKTERTADYAKHAGPLRAKVKDLEDQLVHYCRQYTAIKTGIGHPYRMWQHYQPSSVKEKAEAISKLHNAFYRVYSPDESAAVTPASMAETGEQTPPPVSATAASKASIFSNLLPFPPHITGHDLTIMEEAAPELERLWAEIKPVLCYRESKIQNSHQELKEKATNFFVDYEEGCDTKWKRLRIEFLEDDSLYDFRRLGNEKEDFIGRLHQKILLMDNPIKKRKPGVQTLNDIHLSILGRQHTKDQN